MVPVHRAIDLQSRTVTSLKTKTHICPPPVGNGAAGVDDGDMSRPVRHWRIGARPQDRNWKSNTSLRLWVRLVMSFQLKPSCGHRW